jgi:hypothetical protein
VAGMLLLRLTVQKDVTENERCLFRIFNDEVSTADDI